MHVQTHILAGWGVANLVPRSTRRERLMTMLASSLADLDGLGIVFGQEAYWDYHHRLGHNLPYGLVLCLVLAALSTRGRRALGLAVYLLVFHLHLLMDYYGSGPGWGIPYLWPFSPAEWRRADAWPFYSWQNITAAFATVAWAVWVARRHGRTTLEALMPDLDRRLARMVRPRDRAGETSPAP